MVEARTQVVQGGLIGALVGAAVDAAITSHRASEAEKLVEPIRKEMADFDFRDALFSSLQRTLRSLHALRVANLTTGKAPGRVAEGYQRAPEPAWVRRRGEDSAFSDLVTDDPYQGRQPQVQSWIEQSEQRTPVGRTPLDANDRRRHMEGGNV